MKKVNLVGKIVRLFPVKEYKKESREGKIGSFILADESGTVRVVLWDVNHIKLIEDGIIKQEDTIEISNASLRNAEVHLTGFSDIKLSSAKIESVKIRFDFREKKISEFIMGENVLTRAFIVQAFEPKFFEVCPECNSKAIPSADGSICEKHGRVNPSKRVLISLVIDDGTGSVRAILFSENVEKLLKPEELNSPDGVKEKLLGEEIIFSGTMRQNKMFNNPELFVSNLERVDIEKVIEKLENRK
jgi:ssDNA-binding replication factor A large subunit